MSTKFSEFSTQEKLSKKQLKTVLGGTSTSDDDDHTGPKVLKPVRPTSPTGGN